MILRQRLTKDNLTVVTVRVEGTKTQGGKSGSWILRSIHSTVPNSIKSYKNS
jgi:hypothetical protein